MRIVHRHSETLALLDYPNGDPCVTHWRLTLAIGADRNDTLHGLAYVDGRKVWDASPYRPGAMGRDRVGMLDDARGFLAHWVAWAREPDETTDKREDFTAYGLRLVDNGTLGRLAEYVMIPGAEG